jgi:hypothetical protein
LITSYINQSQHHHSNVDADHQEIFMSYFALLLLIMYDPAKAKEDPSWHVLYENGSSHEFFTLFTKRVQRCLWIQQHMSQLHHNYFSCTHSSHLLESISEPSSSYEISSCSSLSEGIRARIVQNLKHLTEASCL